MVQIKGIVNMSVVVVVVVVVVFSPLLLAFFAVLQEFFSKYLEFCYRVVHLTSKSQRRYQIRSDRYS